MSNSRKVSKTVRGTTQFDGAGVKLVRVIGKADVQDFDPFLMLDAFDSRDPADYVRGFPWHPHRGIETVTYLIAGEIEHGDSLGNKGTIQDGCCQWMTAGSGIMHQEMPQASKRMLGVQLWLNLPRKDKMTVPQYRDLSADMIPKVQEEGCSVVVVAGSYNGIQGATAGDYVPAQLLDVSLESEQEWSLVTKAEETVFIYIIQGAGYFEEHSQQLMDRRQALLFTEGERLYVRAADEGVRFLLFAGRPLHEPVAWGGPIVMNTQEELKQAFSELDNGTFIKY